MRFHKQWLILLGGTLGGILSNVVNCPNEETGRKSRHHLEPCVVTNFPLVLLAIACAVQREFILAFLAFQASVVSALYHLRSEQGRWISRLDFATSGMLLGAFLVWAYLRIGWSSVVVLTLAAMMFIVISNYTQHRPETYDRLHPYIHIIGALLLFFVLLLGV